MFTHHYSCSTPAHLPCTSAVLSFDPFLQEIDLAAAGSRVLMAWECTCPGGCVHKPQTDNKGFCFFPPPRGIKPALPHLFPQLSGNQPGVIWIILHHFNLFPQLHGHWSGLTMCCGKALEPHPVSTPLVISRLEKSLSLEGERLNSANHRIMEGSGLEGH